MPESNLEQEEMLARQQRLYNALELGLTKLQQDPASITTEDAQAFADEVPEGDERTATVAAALQDLAIQNASNNEATLREEEHWPTSRLSQLVEDLYAAVISNPEDVTAKTIETTQNILDMMQQAIHRANAPHPELQAELQQEYARIVPKVERSEADPHALTRQVNGHAQATSTKLRRQISPRSDSSNTSPRATCHHEGPRRDSGLESLEHIKDGMIETQAALALLHMSDHRSSEASAGLSPNSCVDYRRSLDETTNTAPIDNGHHVESPRPDNHVPTNTDNGAPEKAPGLRRRKDSHSVS